MNVNSLVQKFKENASSFYYDLGLKDIDTKHTKILLDAYEQIENISLNDFRNWSKQNDLDCPKQLSLNRGFIRGVIRPIFYKLFKRRSESLLLQALLDDVDTIRYINGLSIMIDNPVHKTPGVSDFYSIASTTINFRWLRYVYLAKRIFDTQILKNGGVWVDIGSYYGGLQGLVKKYNPQVKIVMIDFHHQLCRSYIYLSKIYPDAKHILPNEAEKIKSFDSLPEGSITYLPATNFSQIASFRADLVTNFFSFGEMSHKAFDEYYQSELITKSKNLYIVNRFVSGPFFERTYETNMNILSYIKKDRNIDYFDVFPMHHYMLIERDLFMRRGFRNTSSSYFEYLSSLH